MSVPRVVYWNNQPTPYLVARLNAVVRAATVDLEVWFDELRESDRSWDVNPDTWHFRWRLIPPRKVFGVTARVPISELLETRPDVLVCNYDNLHMILGAVVARSIVRRTGLRVLPAYDAQATINARKTLAWNLVFRIVDGAKVPGPDGERFAARYGLSRDRCWRVTQSIDVAHYGSVLRNRRDESAGRRLRFVVASRMMPGKGIDLVLDAWRRVLDELGDSELTMIGDGFDERRLRNLSADLPSVRWLGFVQPADLPNVYAGADILIFPTLGDPNGLVVEEAMSAGLPVIATDAAGDIRQRVPQDAGWVVRAGDIEALAAAILDAYQLPVLAREAMGEKNVTRAQAFVPERYARDFAHFCNGVLAAPRRSGPIPRLASFASRCCLALHRLYGRRANT
jgi:glycosyltransferase involved in cell wall biosynthesis